MSGLDFSSQRFSRSIFLINFLKNFFLSFSEGKVGSAKGIRLSVLSVRDFTQSNFCGRNSILSNRFGALNRLFFINGFQGFVVSVIKAFKLHNPKDN